MSVSETSALPGFPYLIAALFALMAYREAARLPDEHDEDYISERYKLRRHREGGSSEKGSWFGNLAILARRLESDSRPTHVPGNLALTRLNDEERLESEEYICLLSDVDEGSENEFISQYMQSPDGKR